MELILLEAAIPTIGAGRRKLGVVGSRVPTEVVWADDSAGPMNALRHLPDGTMTAINPDHVVAYAGRRAGLETTGVAALSGGAA